MCRCSRGRFGTPRLSPLPASVAGSRAQRTPATKAAGHRAGAHGGLSPHSPTRLVEENDNGAREKRTSPNSVNQGLGHTAWGSRRVSREGVPRFKEAPGWQLLPIRAWLRVLATPQGFAVGPWMADPLPHPALPESVALKCRTGKLAGLRTTLVGIESGPGFAGRWFHGGARSVGAWGTDRKPNQQVRSWRLAPNCFGVSVEWVRRG
jgi:hypothetical protein